MEPTTPTETTTNPVEMEHKASTGPAIGIAIIVALLAVGGYYFWSTQLPQNTSEVTPSDTLNKTAETWQAPQGTSDTATDIQAEVDATDMAAFEAQMDADMAAVSAAL